MRFIGLVIAVFLFASCGSGPVYMAKTEAEGVKATYSDKALQDAYGQHRALLRDIYARFVAAKVDPYKEGIGFTTIRETKGQGQVYLMVLLRPADLVFDEGKTKPQERLSAVLSQGFDRYLTYMKKDDVNFPDISGLAFGLYWPVRDFSQCDTYGGFIEYAIVYIPKADLFAIKNGVRTFQEVAENAEVHVSLELKPAQSVKPVF